MLRRIIPASALVLAVATSASAGSIGAQSGAVLPYGFMYSPSSSPFEAFEWTPLDFAAFSAYGGDFANVRKPVSPLYFSVEPILPPEPPGFEDEQGTLQMLSMPQVEGFSAGEARMAFMMAVAPPEEPENPVPEPGTLALIGLGLLGASARLRRVLKPPTR